MSRPIEAELKGLRDQIIRMSVLVEGEVERAIQILLYRNDAMSDAVMAHEKLINELEIKVDEHARTIAALQQPMATDLRVLASIIKINTDLERIGDHAVNIVEHAEILNNEPPIETPVYLKELTVASLGMLKNALKAFSDEDVDLAKSVLKQDDEVDDYYNQLFTKVTELIEKDPLIAKTGMNLVMVGHDFERIGDHACNIAEDVIYMKKGKEVRHHHG